MRKIRKPLLIVLSILIGLNAAAQAQDYLACQRNGVVTVCPGNVRLKGGSTLGVSYIPTNIPATSIAGGTVSNTVFGYLANAASDLQAQLNGKLATNGDASSLTNIPAAQLAGSISDARLSANVDLLNGAQTITARKTFPAAGANAVKIPAILGGATNTNGHVVPNVADDTFALLAASQAITNKTISGASNTLSNIGNSSLTNSSITINGTPVSLGGSITTSGPTSTNGSFTASDTTVTSDDTYTDIIGLVTPTLAAGTYLINAEVLLFAAVGVSEQGTMTCQLYNSTAAAAISGSERNGLWITQGGVEIAGYANIIEVVPLAAPGVIKVQVQRGSGPSWVESSVIGSSAGVGTSRMSYVKIN